MSQSGDYRWINPNLDLAYEATVGNGDSGTIVVSSGQTSTVGDMIVNLGLGGAWVNKTIDFTATVQKGPYGSTQPVISVTVFQTFPGSAGARRLNEQRFVTFGSFDLAGTARLDLSVSLA